MIDSEPIMSSQSLSSVLSMFTDRIGQLRATSRLSMNPFLITDCHLVSSFAVSVVNTSLTFLDGEVFDRHDLAEVPREVLESPIAVDAEVDFEETAAFAQCVDQPSGERGLLPLGFESTRDAAEFEHLQVRVCAHTLGQLAQTLCAEPRVALQVQLLDVRQRLQKDL